MALVIEDPQVESLVQRLAELRSESVERTLRDALEAYLALELSQRCIASPEKIPEKVESGAARIMKLAEEFRAGMHLKPFDYDAWLYDENGLPH